MNVFINEEMYKRSTTMKISCTSLILIYKCEFQILNKPQSIWIETVKVVMTIFLSSLILSENFYIIFSISLMHRGLAQSTFITDLIIIKKQPKVWTLKSCLNILQYHAKINNVEYHFFLIFDILCIKKIKLQKISSKDSAFCFIDVHSLQKCDFSFNF